MGVRTCARRVVSVKATAPTTVCNQARRRWDYLLRLVGRVASCCGIDRAELMLVPPVKLRCVAYACGGMSLDW